MDFNQIVADLNLSSAELSRALGVSDGHIRDLKIGRRRLSLKIAARLEKLAERDDIVPAVAAEEAERARSQ
jgi:plasmid maintenance system antidote protein VapI